MLYQRRRRWADVIHKGYTNVLCLLGWQIGHLQKVIHLVVINQTVVSLLFSWLKTSVYDWYSHLPTQGSARRPELRSAGGEKDIGYIYMKYIICYIRPQQGLWQGDGGFEHMPSEVEHATNNWAKKWFCFFKTCIQRAGNEPRALPRQAVVLPATPVPLPFV